MPELLELGGLVKTLHKQLEEKGVELSEFKEKYGIRFQGEEKEVEKDSKDESSDGKTPSVLVS